MVITFYKAQDALIKEALAAADIDEDTWLRVLTVDQAQGSEADVVVLSCVRSNTSHKVGFLANPNRLNVAVSRSRERLIVVGDQNTLKGDARWKALVTACTHVRSIASIPSLTK